MEDYIKTTVLCTLPSFIERFQLMKKIIDTPRFYHFLLWGSSPNHDYGVVWTQATVEDPETLYIYVWSRPDMSMKRLGCPNHSIICARIKSTNWNAFIKSSEE